MTANHVINSLLRDSDSLLIESLDCAVVLIDRAFKIRRVNVAAETLLCRSRRYLHGGTVVDELPIEDVSHYIEQCFSDNAHCTLREARLAQGDATVLIDMTLQRVSDTNAQLDFVLLEISNINRVSRFVREQNQLERQKSFRLMMRGLAHEVKNPLGGIRGAAQLLGRALKDDPPSQELAQIVIKETDRLTRLVDRVMGSRQAPKPVLLNIHEVLEHVAHLVSVESARPLEFIRDYDPTLPEISVDREQIIQAVLNIVGNAIEAQEQNVRIRVGFVTEFRRYVTIDERTFRQGLVVKIWDDGAGVPHAIKNIVFDPLITSRAEGTGLGLSISQEIVQRHHGSVALDKFGGKTCFTVQLPYLDSELEHDATPEHSGSQHE